MKPAKCPVCEGKGKRNPPAYEVEPSGKKTLLSEPPCHGCDGKGWVEVREDNSVFVLANEETS